MLTKKSYPQTREIANFGEIWPIIPNEETEFALLLDVGV